MKHGERKGGKSAKTVDVGKKKRRDIRPSAFYSGNETITTSRSRKPHCTQTRP